MSPNQGFWQSLCAFEERLGITDRQVLPIRALSGPENFSAKANPTLWPGFMLPLMSSYVLF